MEKSIYDFLSELNSIKHKTENNLDLLEKSKTEFFKKSKEVYEETNKTIKHNFGRISVLVCEIETYGLKNYNELSTKIYDILKDSDHIKNAYNMAIKSNF